MEKGKGGILSLWLALMLLAGCTTVRGGGWMESVAGSGKATFGFQLVCDPDDDSVSGQLQYHDQGLGVRLHGTPETTPDECGADATGGYHGTYVPQPRKLGEGGSFYVEITDSGEPGPSAGDSFSISLTGGVYDGYANSGPLQGGNVQTFN